MTFQKTAAKETTVVQNFRNSSTPSWSYDQVITQEDGRVLSLLDSQSSGPGFESRSVHFLNLFLGSPKIKSSATLVNRQLVCLRPVGILRADLHGTTLSPALQAHFFKKSPSGDLLL